MEQRIADLGQVMRRDAGRHAHGDALAAIGQQIGQARRQHDRLLVLAVIGRAEIDGVLVDAFQHDRRGLGQPGLGVAHGGGVIAVDIAEIPLAVDQRKAHGEILRQADHGVIDRDIAMGMVFADDVADHAGRFAMNRIRLQAQLAHGVEQPPVDRLQPVAHIGQRARHDGGERIGEIALAQRIGQRRQADLLTRAGRRRRFCHEISLSESRGNGSRGACSVKPGRQGAQDSGTRVLPAIDAIGPAVEARLPARGDIGNHLAGDGREAEAQMAMAEGEIGIGRFRRARDHRQ